MGVRLEFDLVYFLPDASFLRKCKCKYHPSDGILTKTFPIMFIMLPNT